MPLPFTLHVLHREKLFWPSMPINQMKALKHFMKRMSTAKKDGMPWEACWLEGPVFCMVSMKT